MIRQLLFARPGSAGETVRGWWYLRLSAASLLPLMGWFIYEVATLASLEYHAVREWVASPSTAILFILLIPVLFFHSQSGMQEIIEDYISGEKPKAAASILVRFIAALCAFASILAVMVVCLGF